MRPHEMTPAEQLEALCNARDYYSELAEMLRNRVTTATGHSEKLERQEQKARKFAAAYDNSVKIQRAAIEMRRHRRAKSGADRQPAITSVPAPIRLSCSAARRAHRARRCAPARPG